MRYQVRSTDTSGKEHDERYTRDLDIAIMRARNALHEPDVVKVSIEKIDESQSSLRLGLLCLDSSLGKAPIPSENLTKERKKMSQWEILGITEDQREVPLHSVEGDRALGAAIALKFSAESDCHVVYLIRGDTGQIVACYADGRLDNAI